MFFLKLIRKLLKIININNYVIKLKINKLLFYKLIYKPELVKLKILKIYVKTSLTNSIIKLFKFFINFQIMFVYKNNENIKLRVNK